MYDVVQMITRDVECGSCISKKRGGGARGVKTAPKREREFYQH